MGGFFDIWTGVLRRVGFGLGALGALLAVYLAVPAYVSLHTPVQTEVQRRGTPDVNTTILVFFGDPQIEGDFRISSEGLYGRLAVAMNDGFMWHVAGNVARWIRPSAAVVMGDIFSSQWVTDEEFNRRHERFNWMFSAVGEANDVRLFNISGNHDVGYANELHPFQVRRFEEKFGPMNSISVDDLVPGHIVAFVNGMNIDAPARNPVLREQTWKHLRRVARVRQELNLPLILVTHIPLHKPAGNCVDEPQMKYSSKSGLLIQQNFLSENATSYILETLQPFYIFSGHDHEGCDYTHSARTKDGHDLTIREFTIRSVMGDYGGNVDALAVVSSRGKSDSAPHHTYIHFRQEFIYMKAATAFVVICAVWVGLSLLTGTVIYIR